MLGLGTALATDWKDYHRKRKEEFGTFLGAMDAVAVEVGPPKAEYKPGDMGRPPHSPTAMLKVNLLRVYQKLSYRDMASYLEANPDVRARLGLKTAPAHDTIHRHAEKLGDMYLQRFNAALVAHLKKTRLTPASMLPVSRSRGTRDVGALPRPNSGATTSGSRPTSQSKRTRRPSSPGA